MSFLPSLEYPLNLYRVPDGVIQVFIKELQLNTSIERAYIVINFTDQLYQSSISENQKHVWYEGFEFKISYHQQLFDKIQFSVYESNFLLADRLIGSFDLKLLSLENRPEIFTENFELIDKSVPYSKNGAASKPIGHLRTRVNYRYQKKEDPEPRILKSKTKSAFFKNSLGEQVKNLQSEALISISSKLNSSELVDKFMVRYNECAESTCIKSEGLQSGSILNLKQTELFTNDIIERISNNTHHPSKSKKEQTDLLLVDDFIGESYNGGDNAQQSQEQDREMLSVFNLAQSEATHSVNPLSISNAEKGESESESASTINNTEQPQKKPNESNWPFDIFSNLNIGTSSNLFNTSNVIDPKLDKPNIQPETKDKSNPVDKSNPADKSAQSSPIIKNKQKNDVTFLNNPFFTCLRMWNTFFQGLGLSSNQLINGIMQLVYYQSDPDYISMKLLLSSHTPILPQYLDLPAHYSHFSLAAYGWRLIFYFNKGVTLLDGTKQDSDLQSIVNYLKLSPEDILDYELTGDKVFIPTYFVSYDKNYDAVVLSIRGTLSTHDLLVDMTCEYEKWRGGLVHSGIRSMAQWLFAQVMPLIISYAHKNNTKNVNIVGHSLGGGTAAVLMLILKFEYENLLKAGVPLSDIKFNAFTYGCLPCVSSELVETMSESNLDTIDYSNFSIHNFVYENDMIPSLSYGSFLDTFDIIMPAYDISDTLFESIAQKFETKDQVRLKEMKKYKALAEQQKKAITNSENLKLLLPGNTYHIRGTPTHEVPLRKTELANILAPHVFVIDKETKNEATLQNKGSPKLGEKKVIQGYKPTFVYKIPNQSLSNIEFNRNMISDHFPIKYEDSLKNALMTTSSCVSSDQT